jgi:hypothetical protein
LGLISRILLHRKQGCSHRAPERHTLLPAGTAPGPWLMSHRAGVRVGPGQIFPLWAPASYPQDSSPQLTVTKELSPHRCTLLAAGDQRLQRHPLDEVQDVPKPHPPSALLLRLGVPVPLCEAVLPSDVSASLRHPKRRSPVHSCLGKTQPPASSPEPGRGTPATHPLGHLPIEKDHSAVVADTAVHHRPAGESEVSMCAS